ncbi:cytosolic enolase [Carex rostrata]
MSVQEYLDKYLVARKIEDAVNAAVRAKASDPILFIANHIKRAVSPVITKIKARQILDSRGIPTIEVDLFTNKGSYRASVPSADVSLAASVAVHEALELRDHNNAKYFGNGVYKAVAIINDKISEALIGMDPKQQSQIDQAMIDLDKTDNKSALGANAMLAVSIAACKAGAAEKEVSLYKHIADLSGKTNAVIPVPAITVISGGKHAGNNLAVKEIMIMPLGASNFEDAMQMGVETYHHLKAIISERHGPTGCNVGDDGGLAPNISSISEGLDLVIEAIDRAGYNGRIKLALNVSATDFCFGKKYDMDFKSQSESGKHFKTGQEMIEMYTKLCTDYPIVSITQPFDKDDWENTKVFTALEHCQVVGDDLLMSNPKRVERAINEFTCNALLLKVNQVGTVTEAIEVVKQAKDTNWGVVVSHRSGETNDSFISDFAVGIGAGQIKAGAPYCGEHISKYNQLLRIEEELGSGVVYAGENWRSP